MMAHLAERGWKDIVQVDKGPLPNPGGSTGHASNFIFPVDHGKELTTLTLESQRQYEEMGVNTTCGGIEVDRTEERMEELRRRMSSAVAWGIPSELLTPAQVKEMVPFIDESVIVGGFYTPSVSVVDSLRAGTIFRERAQALGALEVFPNTAVSDVDGAVEVESRHGGVDLTRLGGDVRVDVRHGGLHTAQLTSPSVDVTTRHGSVVLQFSAPPQRVAVDSSRAIEAAIRGT